jgi:hypothetical protein
VLAFVAIKPVCSFDACSAQNNYGRDLALNFFDRVGFSMNTRRKWTTRFKYAEYHCTTDRQTPPDTIEIPLTEILDRIIIKE